MSAATWDRARIARVAAAAAFLLAVTIAVLLVRSALREDDAPPSDPVAVLPAASGPATVVVRPGDTLEGIAERAGTTVAAVTRLNPGLDPDVLRVGQRVRVRS